MYTSPRKSRQAPRALRSLSSQGSRSPRSSSPSGSRSPQTRAPSPLVPVRTIGAGKRQQDFVAKDAGPPSPQPKAERESLPDNEKGGPMVTSVREGARPAEDAQEADPEVSGSFQQQSGAHHPKASPDMADPPALEGGSATPVDSQQTAGPVGGAELASSEIIPTCPSSTQTLWVRQSQMAKRTKVIVVTVAVLALLALLVGMVVIVTIVVSAMHKTQSPCLDSELDLLVETALGTIRGVRVETEDGGGARVFLGIPYAANVSEERLFDLASIVHQLVPSPFPAVQKGPACVQPLVFPFGQHQPTNVSEECLTMNVYTPSGCSLKRVGGEPLPVLFFVTGWRFYTLNWNGMFDWHQLAARGRVIVVVPNYRVGVIGFLSRDHNGTSNMGVRDVLLAWHWTRTHIGAFGGDPTTVVPLGHAAGALMISELLLRPRLLKSRRAILLSQSMFILVDGSREIALLRAREVGHLANCCAELKCQSMPVPDIARCLSHLNGSYLLETLGRNFGLPTLDVTMEPFGLRPLDFPRESDFFNGTQLLIGTNLHEHDNLLRAWMASQNLTRSPFRHIVERFISHIHADSSLTDWVMAFVGSDVSREEQVARALKLSTKVIHHCTLTHYASEASKSGAQVRFFVLDEQWSAMKDLVHNDSSYGDDLYFISGSVLNETGITAAQRRLAEELMDNVAAFARTGKPGLVKGVGEWPLRSVGKAEVVILSSNGSRVTPYWSKEPCDFIINLLKNKG